MFIDVPDIEIFIVPSIGFPLSAWLDLFVSNHHELCSLVDSPKVFLSRWSGHGQDPLYIFRIFNR